MSNGLYSRARELLVVAQDALGDTAPERAFVTFGPVVPDPITDDQGNCAGQLTVNIRTVGIARNNNNPCFVGLRPVLGLGLLRCITALTDDAPHIPSADILEPEAEGLGADAVALLNAVLGQARAQTLFAGLTCSDVTFGPLTALRPDGGLAGWEWDITLSTI